MNEYPAPLARLVDELRRLPGVGPKSAQRIAFHLLKAPKEDAQRLAEAVGELQQALRLCSTCNAITDREVCATCADASRSDRVVCVVEEPHNLLGSSARATSRAATTCCTARSRPCRASGPTS